MRHKSICIPGGRKRQRVNIWVMVGLITLLFATLGSTASTVQAASGDWPTYQANNGRSGFNSAETIINPTTAPHLKLHWTATAAGAISTQPVEANGMIYWGSWDGNEHATTLSNVQVWSANLGTTTAPGCSPTIGLASTATVATVVINGTSTPVDFVGGGNGYFYALNATTGAIIWQTLLGSPPSHFIWSSPAVYNSSVYVGMASFGDCPLVQGQLIQMNVATGGIQHTFNVVPSHCTGGGVWGSPTIDQVTGMIYFATGNGGSCAQTELYATALVEVRASDLSFVSSWQIPSAQRVPDSDFGSTPTLFTATIKGAVRSLVGLSNKNGEYYTFDRTAINNGPLWQTRIAVGGPCAKCGLGPISPSAWDGSTLYVAGGNVTIRGKKCQGSLQALDPTRGHTLWEDCLTSGPVLGAVTAVPGLVVVGQGSYLMVFDANSGQTLFSYQDTHKGAAFYGPASISNGVLYIGNKDGNLYAFGR